MTPERLAEIRTRCEKAIPGPWIFHPHPGVIQAHGHFDYICTMQVSNCPNFRSDADFIAHARTDIPSLLAEIEVYEAVLKDIYEDTFVGCPLEVLISQAREKQLPHQRSCTFDTPPA